MKKILIIIMLLLTTVFSALSTCCSTEKNVWEQFIKTTDEVDYKLCSNLINMSLSDNKIKSTIKNDLINNYEIYNNFLKLIRKVNPYAIELAMQLYPLTDGGSSEDLFGQIGMIVKENPDLLLAMFDKYQITSLQIISKMVSSFPVEEFVDNLDKRTIEIENRINALKTVENKDLISTRDKCIQVLLDHLERLHNMEK